MRSGELSDETNDAGTRQNICAEGKFRPLGASEGQPLDSDCFDDAFQIEKIQPASGGTPVNATAGVARKNQGQISFFQRVWRTESVAEFKQANARGAIADVATENFEQTGEKRRPQRDVIFTEWIAQLDRARPD